MAHYLIYIPKVSGCDPTPLIKAGLGDLLRDDDSSPEAMAVDRGPDGGSGTIFGWRRNSQHDVRIGMYPEIVWQPCLDLGEQLPVGRFWFGVDKERKPQPADMVRPTIISGHTVTMADGFTYTVPTISKLPHTFTVRDGELTRKVKDKYQEFYTLGMALAKGILEQFSMIDMLQEAKQEELEQYSIQVSVQDGLKLIAMALGLNYRLNFEICMLLSMFDEQSSMWAFLKFCELDQIRAATAAQKKTLEPISIHAGLLMSAGARA